MRTWADAVPSGVRSRATPETLPSDTGRLLLSGPHLAVLAVLVPLLLLIWRPGDLVGADTWGHLFRAEYLAGRLHHDGLRALVGSAWMPAWYLGDPYRTYYPPLTVTLLGPLVWICMGSSAVALRLFLSVVFVGLAHLTYLASARREEGGRWAAAVSAMLVVIAPYTLRTAFDEGNLPRLLAVLALPVLGWLVERVLVRPTALALVALALAWCWTILAHVQQAYVFAVAFGVYALVRLVTGSDVRVGAAVRAQMAAALGAALAAPWLLPAYSFTEMPGVPYIPPEKTASAQFAADLGSVLPALASSPSEIVIGLGTLLLALVALWLRPSSRRVAWGLSGLLCVALSFRPGILALIPGSTQLLPERFLNFAAFALAVTAGGVLPLAASFAWRCVVAAAGLLAALDGLPALSLAAARVDSAAAAAASKLLGRQPAPGRVAIFAYPEPSGVDVYHAARSGHDLAGGWAIENSPHQVVQRRLNVAPTWGTAYHRRLLDLWNVRYALLHATDHPDSRMLAGTRQALEEAGFVTRGDRGPYEVMEWVRPGGSMVRELPARQMLVLGAGAQPLLNAYPFAHEASRPELDRLPADELGRYPAIALMRFARTPRAAQEAEARVRQFVADGGTAVVDLSGMDDSMGERWFLGVRARPVSYTSGLPIRWSGALADAPTPLAVDGTDPVPWRGTVYEGLETVLGDVDVEGVPWAVFGSKAVGRGHVWFVGLNLFYHCQQHHAPALAERLSALTLEGVDVDRRVTLDPLPLLREQVGDGRIELAYDAPREVDALVSFTYSPRWRAEVDGQPVALGEYEHLMRVRMPAGAHTVALRYEPYGTAWPRAGRWVGVAAAALAAALVVRDRRHPPHRTAARREVLRVSA